MIEASDTENEYYKYCFGALGRARWSGMVSESIE
jgi:hypothetical protein